MSENDSGSTVAQRGWSYNITYRDILLFAFGIILPIIALGVEFLIHICGQVFFDPIPSPGHMLLIALVPIANFLVWKTYADRGTKHPIWVGFANGMAIGVSLLYAVIFVPLLALSVIAIMIMGLGVLCWAPLLSLLSAIFGRFWLKQFAPEAFTATRMPTFVGFLSAIMILAGLEMPSSLTRVGMDMASSPRSQAQGVRYLRALGDTDTMLRMCYDRSGRATDLLGFLVNLTNPVSAEEARQIFFRVTGTPFNTVPVPDYMRGSRAWDGLDWFDNDFEQGGDAVGGIARGLSLTDSRLDGSIDSDAALSYTEWTLTFKNTSPVPREARAQICLPPGGVVSRLTLWVNGEEREASFAGRHNVRQAYEGVVKQRRDPVLVTTAGPDRVLVQCFPVPADGEGTMKVRLGITAPLLLEGRDKAVLALPRFLERNFQVTCTHSTWMECRKPLGARTELLVSEHPEPNVYGVRGKLPHKMLEAGTAIEAKRSPDITAAWTEDPLSKGKQAIVETFQRVLATKPKRFLVVIDGSKSMADHQTDIVDALNQNLRFLPQSTDTSVILASDDSEVLAPLADDKARENICQGVKELKKLPLVGGRDNIPALERAWDIASESPDSVVLWMHGPQPVILTDPESLRQRLERRPQGPLVYDFQIVNGPNRFVEKLEGLASWKTIPTLYGAREDLTRAVSQWYGYVEAFLPVRERMPIAPPGKLQSDTTTVKTSSHLARLWGRDQVSRDLAEKSIDQAIATAASYQLVTPVSGAVVLETKEQYQNAGLQPVDPATVPTVPEPDMWLLLIAAAIVLVVSCGRFRKSETRA